MSYISIRLFSVFPPACLIVSISNSIITGQVDVKNGSACWVENPWRRYFFMVPCYLYLLADLLCFISIARVVIKSSQMSSGNSTANLHVRY